MVLTDPALRALIDEMRKEASYPTFGATPHPNASDVYLVDPHTLRGWIAQLEALDGRAGCDHKFVDSTTCLKCGWDPSKGRAAPEPETGWQALVTKWRDSAHGGLRLMGNAPEYVSARAACDTLLTCADELAAAAAVPPPPAHEREELNTRTASRSTMPSVRCGTRLKTSKTQ